MNNNDVKNQEKRIPVNIKRTVEVEVEAEPSRTIWISETINHRNLELPTVDNFNSNSIKDIEIIHSGIYVLSARAEIR